MPQMTATPVETDAAPPFPEWPTIRVAPVGALEIAYETFGDPTDDAILLVMGLGTQMIAWPDAMCEALADAGHHVIRFDNRDCGLTTKVDAPTPSIPDILLKRRTPYTLDDMAGDAFGLLDHLGIERAHVVGTSMGGFIAQTMALRSPERVRTLSLSMTSTGSRRVGRPAPAIVKMMATAKPPVDRAAAVEEAVTVNAILGSPAHHDADHIRRLAGVAYDRSHEPDGRMRQLAAIMAQPNRTDRLKQLQVPTMVVHGLADPLVHVSGGIALAKAIPGAIFVGHHGMGHDLPLTMWRALTDDVLSLIARSSG
jgi:pimeloyl-ACP methyl ester carboxylesterase